ncbi:MAG TPA: glycosyltransferase family 2 protein [Candidatus Saccharimonadales bacterium]|nr:glycosyltransferase family 2 protein [Candidatus Saccharimonadales bacterium]
MRSIEIPQPEDRDWRYRAFEILPGALTWIVLILPVIFSIVSPRLATYFIIAYLLLWFVRAVGLNVRSFQGWRQMKSHRNMPWQKLNADLEILELKTKNLPKWHERNLARVKQYMPERMKPSEIYHAVFIAFYNEPQEIVESTVQSVLASDYDMKKIMLVLAYEERGGKAADDLAKYLIKKYGSKFYSAVASKHPADIPGEVIGKGGNITYAGFVFQKFIEKQKIDPLRVMVTTLDADNRPDPQYFAALTYTYCSTEEPKYSSYQPIPMYTNNIWDAPAPMRVIATGNSFWNVVLSMRPHMLRNFSSHAQPLAALIDTDFWSVRTIVEDGHQYWRTYFRYDGKHDVYPIFVPIYQDAVLTDSYKRTLKMQFIQIQRWAWGASDVAYVAYNGFLKPNRIPKTKVLAKFWRLLEGHLSWSTAPLIIALAALVPFFLNPQSYIANQLPQVASKLQTVAMVGILMTLYLSFQALPPKPARYKRRRTLWMMVQWIYLPVTTILYNGFAAVNAQTRLMFGWYISKFNVTEKAIKSERADVANM